MGPLTIECAAPHEVMAQLDAGVQSIDDHIDIGGALDAVGRGVPPLGFGMPAMGALAVLSLLCISFAGQAFYGMDFHEATVLLDCIGITSIAFLVILDAHQHGAVRDSDDFTNFSGFWFRFYVNYNIFTWN
ncbi:hypothetical protein CYMTET_49818 [Cymbomonas tetramitiformis]|uniref:Uncharacterized protein n=1 Tax=Cymbomonas tetramitiformis TaxID=36881 RepID=A0AAE0BPE2_9CHLO|nr:hypothetical protein CYMTET_49818 [Cymbomonas tetramitiformis]